MITQELLKQYLHYCPETGVFTWIGRLKRVTVGKTAGTPNGNGYLRIRIFRVLYHAHRLAWLYVYGEFSKLNIDHINGNKSDNRIENLRESTMAQNLKNFGKPRDNKSGFKGVHFDKARNKWLAQARLNGKSFHLGRYDSAIDASHAYNEFAKRHHGEFLHRSLK